MFAKLLAFETKLHMRQVGFWIVCVLMFAVGALIMGTDAITITGGSGERVKTNGAIAIALNTSVISLLSIFFGAIFVVSGAMRDEMSKSLEIIHATPIRTWVMTSTRMIGVYIATFLSMLAGVAGLFAGQFSPFLDAEVLAPVNILHFLQPAILFVGVNALLVSGLFIAVAAITRNRTLVYVSAIGLFILYTVSGLIIGENAPDLITSLVDPFGANALALTTQFWPADEQNTVMSPIWGYVGLNRLVWGGVGLGLLVATFGLFKRGIVSRKTNLGAVDETDISRGRIQLATLAAPLARGGWKPVWARFKHEYLTTVRSISFIILSMLALALFGLSVYVSAEFAPDPILPTNLSMAQTVLGSATLPLLIMIVFFSGEIIWRDKSSGITEILDATPVRNGPLMLGKWLAMYGVILTITCLAVVLGILAQLVMGDVSLNLGTHLQAAFVTFVPDILLYATLVLFLQNFMPNRIVGMVAGGAILAFFIFFDTLLPFYHPLMGYGNVPTGGVSEMNGLGAPLRFTWFLIYWTSLALVFAAMTIWLWRRGLQSSLMTRFRGLVGRVTPITAGIAVLGLVGFGTAGASIYNSYSVDNNYENRDAREARQANFETELGALLKLALPKVRSVEVSADFYPSEQTARFMGHYEVENTTTAPLTELYVTVPTSNTERVKLLDVEGATWVEAPEKSEALKQARARLYTFGTPVPEGGTFAISFDTEFPAPSIGNDGIIRKNGTFVNNFATMPQIGLQDQRLTNPDRRRKYDLGPRELRAERDDQEARQSNFITRSSDYVDFKATVCTDPGQVPIAPGKLERTYEEDGRSCRVYKAINPILNFFSFISADYEIRRDVWANPDGADIDLAIYFDRQHDYNIDLMIQAMKDSLDTFTRLFGPYQYSQVRIMEFPYGGFAQSFAGTIPFSENIGFVLDPKDPDDTRSIDVATYVTMHEIGHQWFAHQIVPADTKGFNVLSEGLTENAAYTAYEEKFGWQRTRRLLEQRAIRSYLLQRTVDSNNEPPLALAGDQQYLVYNKASWVFWGLKQYMGEAQMQGAIQAFLQEYGSKGPLYPTTAELISYLREAAGPDYQQLITDYWDRITFWDVGIKADTLDVSQAGENGDGYTVRLILTVDKKIAAEDTGKETSVTEMENETLNEWVEIGLYAQNPEDTLGDEWLVLERYHVTEPETEIMINVSEAPSHILLDPRRLLIERNTDDNGKKLETG